MERFESLDDRKKKLFSAILDLIDDYVTSEVESYREKLSRRKPVKSRRIIPQPRKIDIEESKRFLESQKQEAINMQKNEDKPFFLAGLDLSIGSLINDNSEDTGPVVAPTYDELINNFKEDEIENENNQQKILTITENDDGELVDSNGRKWSRKWLQGVPHI